MKFDLESAPKTNKLPKGFLYVGQDNFYVGDAHDETIRYLYSDSATSCIIIVLEGKDENGKDIVALSHLSRIERFHSFFDKVNNHFHGEVAAFVQGANPPQPLLNATTNDLDYTSLRNARMVTDWLTQHTPSNEHNEIIIPPDQSYTFNWYIKQSTISLGLGNPTFCHRGCYGINLNDMTVSNHQFDLTLNDRDQTGGLQTLFCVFGLKVKPQIVLHNVLEEFTDAQKEKLVNQAHEENWEDIADLTDEEILKKYSSTPEYEASWFCDTMRESSNYVINHYKGDK